MHVTPHVPVTWRNRSLPHLLAALDLSGRCAHVMRGVSAGDGVFAALRRLSRPILARIHKARSVTQTPSALERHEEEIVALHLAGVPNHQLRLVAVDLHLLVDDLTSRPVTSADVLEAIAQSDRTEAAEQLAESKLTTRPDRAVIAPDVDGLIDATRADLAADSEKLSRLVALKRALAASRRPVPLVRLGTRRPA